MHFDVDALLLHRERHRVADVVQVSVGGTGK